MRSYSRRELYALGETLGDSATQHKLGGGRIYGGGGGGGPTQSTTQTSNIPEYARPYVENMLQSGQTQIYNDDMTTFRPYKAYSSNVNDYFAGFSPMQTQAQQAAGQMQTPGQFAAGSGLASAAGLGALGAQGQAGLLGGEALGYGQAGAGYGQAGQLYGAQGAQQANMAAQQAQRAAQMYGRQGSMYGAQAANLAPTAQMYGQGAANIGMQGLGYGAQGAGFGQQAANMAGMGFGAGQQYAQQVTDPNAVAQYMSPYQQQVTDIAKTDAVRNAQLAQQQANLGSARQGTYGGARQALAQSEREKNLMSNLSNIQAQGSQSAFDRAIASQQFGSNLGLQGIQTGLQGIQAGQQGVSQGLAGTAQGMQGAGIGLQGVGAQQAGYAGAGQAAATLGGLGSQQQAADINKINLQSQMGGQQQQLEQNKINQAIQDYATQQQYPFMQLGMMNALLRGLPLQQTTTQQYQAQPGFAQQAMGLGLGAAGLSKAFGS